MNELDKLIVISKYAGERFDLVQAGGGNTSVKLTDGRMLIKASGYLLSELSAQKGISEVDNLLILDILKDDSITAEPDKRKREKRASDALKNSMKVGSEKPSIETFLHALLLKYTLHVHSISVNILTSHKDWENQVKLLGDRILSIPYETPGIDLAIAMKDGIANYSEQYGELPKVICLQNHGLIITSNDIHEIEPLTEEVVIKAEGLCGITLAEYRRTTVLSKWLNKHSGESLITYRVNDRYILETKDSHRAKFSLTPFSPDGYIFCGYHALEVDDELAAKPLKEYLNKYHEVPRILIYKDNIFIAAADLKKAKMIEDVLKNNLMILNALEENINFLPEDELHYLGNWEAEKHRQNL